MAKSYKRHPGFSDHNQGKKWAKNQANRKVRHYTKGLSNGGNYKKLYEQWNICDYNSRHYSWRETYDYLIDWFSWDSYYINKKSLTFWGQFWDWVGK
jgi:hypothetical protein